MTISIGRLNWCACVPASAHQAVTSSASGPGPKPLVNPLGAATGAMRSTSQSLADDQSSAGIVAEAKPSAEFTVVEDEEVVFFSTYGTGVPELYTVKWMRNGARFPAASCNSPASVCGPTPSAPV